MIELPLAGDVSMGFLIDDECEFLSLKYFACGERLLAPAH